MRQTRTAKFAARVQNLFSACLVTLATSEVHSYSFWAGEEKAGLTSGSLLLSGGQADGRGSCTDLLVCKQWN